MTLTNLIKVNSDMMSPSFSYRNRIINGDMRIDQRNVGAQQIVNTTAFPYTCDRWLLAPTGNSVAGQRTSNSSGYFYTITGNTSVTACALLQRIEGNNILDILGANVTVSAKISSTTLSNLSWQVAYPNNSLDNWTTGANNITYQTTAFAINSTPTVYSLTFTANNSCVNGMQVTLASAGFTSGNLTITDVQLEAGNVPSPFERLSTDQQLTSCQRYYQKSYNQGTVPGTSVASGAGGIWILQAGATGPPTWYGNLTKYPVIMRALPTLTAYDDAGTLSRASYQDSSGTWHNGVTAGQPGYFIQSQYDYGFAFGVNQAGGMDGFSVNYTASAEL
jgi:hypothetical protein